MNYNFDRLPETWGVDIFENINHPRLEEFKKCYLEIKKIKYNLQWGYRFYGVSLSGCTYNCDEIPGANMAFNNNILTLDTFFSLIEEPIIEVGDYLVCKKEFIYHNGERKLSIGEKRKIISEQNYPSCICIEPDKDMGVWIMPETDIKKYFFIEKNLKLEVGNWLVRIKDCVHPLIIGKLYQVKDNGRDKYVSMEDGSELLLWDSNYVNTHFRNATPEEIASLDKESEHNEWIPKHGSKVIVSEDNITYSGFPYIFLYTHKKMFIVESTVVSNEITLEKYIKPYTDPHELTPEEKEQIKQIEEKRKVKITMTVCPS